MSILLRPPRAAPNQPAPWFASRRRSRRRGHDSGRGDGGGTADGRPPGGAGAAAAGSTPRGRPPALGLMEHRPCSDIRHRLGGMAQATPGGRWTVRNRPSGPAERIYNMPAPAIAMPRWAQPTLREWRCPDTPGGYCGGSDRNVTSSYVGARPNDTRRTRPCTKTRARKFF